VADTGNDRVCVFTPDGQFLFEFGGTGVLKPDGGAPANWRPGRFNFPAGVAVDERGEVYVADTHNNQIQVFAPDGSFRRAFPDAARTVGRGSSGAGGGIAVTSIAVRNGIVAATDSYQVFIFDATGRLLHQFGKPGRGDGDLDHPGGVAIGDDGTIYVSDSNHARLTAFDPDGRVLWNLGSIPADLKDATRRTFSLPRGIAIAGDRLIVADTFGFQLVTVSSTGEVLRRLGTRGVDPATFNFPNDVDCSGEFVLVCDRGNNRVQVVRIEGSSDEHR
jgi:DNA-binding beta-propeller fold protein YncE